MFALEFTPEAIEDLAALRKYDQRQLLETIEKQLPHQPEQETRNRKRLRPNKLAQWELRIDTFRIFYDVAGEESVVKIVAVGHKQWNTLYIHGEEYEL